MSLIKNVMVIIPSAGRISYGTERMVYENFEAKNVVRLAGCSDVSMARNLAAALAKARLLETEGEERWVVLWLDDDMFTDRVTLDRHIALIYEHAPARRAISGCYVMRQRPTQLAMCWISDPPHGSPPGLIPMVGGFGCVGMSAEHFMEHLGTCPTYQTAERSIACMFQSGLQRFDETNCKWISEDHHACGMIWETAPEGGGVYFDPMLRYGHELAPIKYPDERVTINAVDMPDDPKPLGLVIKSLL